MFKQNINLQKAPAAKASTQMFQLFLFWISTSVTKNLNCVPIGSWPGPTSRINKGAI